MIPPSSEDKTWRKYKTGDYFGYPRCCQDEFYAILYNLSKRTENQKKASNNSGFIPCVKHAEEIVAGILRLEDLILPTRKHPKPFKIV